MSARGLIISWAAKRVIGPSRGKKGGGGRKGGETARISLLVSAVFINVRRRLRVNAARNSE